MYRAYRNGLMMVAQRPCHECGRTPFLRIGIRWTSAEAKSRLCGRCHRQAIDARRPYQLKAIQAVNAAKQARAIPPACELTCVDCGSPAFDYDHRDYAHPLRVDPVCRGCNIRRGYALVTGLSGCAGRMPICRISPRRPAVITPFPLDSHEPNVTTFGSERNSVHSRTLRSQEMPTVASAGLTA
jgi:hypothetical protein